MREIDEVRIEGDQLIIYDTKGERHRFKMGVPEQVRAEVLAKIPEDKFAEGDRFADALRLVESFSPSAHDQIAHDGTAELNRRRQS